MSSTHMLLNNVSFSNVVEMARIPKIHTSLHCMLVSGQLEFCHFFLRLER